MGELLNRRAYTNGRLIELRSRLDVQAAQLVANNACVYATGSFGRLEASSHSDLDLFICGKTSDEKAKSGKLESLLRPLDAICLKAELIELTRQFKFPEFSGDGRYLIHYSIGELIKTLGEPEDDVTNTFTARLLLLLESKPLLGELVYQDVIEKVIAEYWKDYEDHKSDFMPAFLANDILRLWRTFCVNYEARTRDIPPMEKAKRKLKNYKLKHSRLLTCFSAILYMLFVHISKNTVSPQDVVHMAGLTPTERLEWLRDQPVLGESNNTIIQLLSQYEAFLSTTNADENTLIERFSDKKTSAEYMRAASSFGELAFTALNTMGNGNRFFRLIVV